MTDYYKILGVEEEASIEEIEARVVELEKRYSFSSKEGGRASERIKEIKEAYEILKNPSTRKEYDVERALKRSILEKMRQRRKERYDRKKLIIKSLIIPAGAVVLFLVVGLFILRTAPLTIQQKPVTPTSTPVPEETKPISVSKSVRGEAPKASDEKSSQTIAEQMAKSQETISSVAALPRTELEPKEKIAKEPGKTERIIPREMPKPEVSKGLKPMPEERPKVEEPKPATIEPRPATAYVPVPEKVQKSEVAAVIEVKKTEIIQSKVPREVPKEVMKETPKEPAKEPLKEVPKEVLKEAPKEPPKEALKEVSRVLPKEKVKTTPQEPPASQPSQPIEAKPMGQKSQGAQIPSAKPSPPTAAIRPMPPPFVVEENEVSEFLAKYADRYTQRDIEGFLSFFSPMAIQNQKDRIEKIREMYSKQFERYERFRYQLKDPKMKILENSVKVRASYEIEQFSKEGETKQLRGDIEWELIREGKELKVLTIEYKPEKTK